MITRIKLPDGSTHLRNPSDVRQTLCGLAASEADPFGETFAPETQEPVSCPHCVKTYCAVKDEPWGGRNKELFTDATFEAGVYATVKPDTDRKGNNK